MPAPGAGATQEVPAATSEQSVNSEGSSKMSQLVDIVLQDAARAPAAAAAAESGAPGAVVAGTQSGEAQNGTGGAAPALAGSVAPPPAPAAAGAGAAGGASGAAGASAAGDFASPPADVGGVKKRPTRTWTAEQRLHHRAACKAKGKLSLGQKLDIIAQHQSRNPANRKTQAQLAQIYGKSRSAISKILRPENIAKLKNISDTGVHKGVKRYSHVLPQLELEKRIHEMMVQRAGNPPRVCYGRRAEVMAFAQKIAVEAGITDFRPTYGWYARFLKRHGLSEGTEDGAVADSRANAGSDDDGFSDSLGGSEDDLGAGHGGGSGSGKRRKRNSGEPNFNVSASQLQMLLSAIRKTESGGQASANEMTQQQFQQIMQGMQQVRRVFTPPLCVRVRILKPSRAAPRGNCGVAPSHHLASCDGYVG